MKTYSINLSSSRLVSGNSVIYDDLEQDISNYLNFEACLICNSGYDANLALFYIFKNENVIVFSDEKNHASIIDGIKLSGLQKVIYPHLDYEDLEEHLAWDTHEDVQKVIVSDSVFSTSGKTVDIKKLVNLKQRYNAILIIDASHSLGLNMIENHDVIDILTASLSRAWGAHGGVILSSKDIRDLIINQGRSLIYSSSLPIHNLYFIKESLQHVIEEEYRREKLNTLSEYFNRKFKVLFHNQSTSGTLIKNIACDSLATGRTRYEMLYDHGIFVRYLRHPTVTQPTLRISLSYFHEAGDVDRLFNFINQCELGDSHV